MEMYEMYELVFQDMVKCYLENLDKETLEELKITQGDIEIIAYKMIYKNEYLWEVINDTIDAYLGCNLINDKEED